MILSIFLFHTQRLWAPFRNIYLSKVQTRTQSRNHTCAHRARAGVHIQFLRLIWVNNNEIEGDFLDIYWSVQPATGEGEETKDDRAEATKDDRTEETMGDRAEEGQCAAPCTTLQSNHTKQTHLGLLFH